MIPMRPHACSTPRGPPRGGGAALGDALRGALIRTRAAVAELQGAEPDAASDPDADPDDDPGENGPN